MKKKLTWNTIFLLFSLYTTQFLGLGFFIEAFIGILRQNGVSLENLGFIYMLGLFWVFRFLWAPFIDKISGKQQARPGGKHQCLRRGLGRQPWGCGKSAFAGL